MLTSPRCDCVSPGNLTFQWLLTQCNDCETKNEYQMSHSLLTKFLFLPETIKALGYPCIKDIRNLQSNLQAKEEKYAGWRRMTIKNCMDTMTTSPVEGHNQV